MLAEQEGRPDCLRSSHQPGYHAACCALQPLLLPARYYRRRQSKRSAATALPVMEAPYLVISLQVTSPSDSVREGRVDRSTRRVRAQRGAVVLPSSAAGASSRLLAPAGVVHVRRESEVVAAGLADVGSHHVDGARACSQQQGGGGAGAGYQGSTKKEDEAGRRPERRREGEEACSAPGMHSAVGGASSSCVRHYSCLVGREDPRRDHSNHLQRAADCAGRRVVGGNPSRRCAVLLAAPLAGVLASRNAP